LEVNNVWTQLLDMNPSLLVKFKRNSTILDKKFIHLDEELEKVVRLVGEKIEAKFGEFSNEFLEVMGIEDTCWSALEERVTALEGIVALFTGLLSSVQQCVRELEDAMLEESDAEEDVDPVENIVAILVPAPSVIHMLVPVNTPEEFIPPSLHGMPSPPYVRDRDEDLVHDGVPEYWVDPGV
jgi:hypothetical protein